MKKREIDLPFGISIVVANMIGIGIYTSLGFQVADIKSVTAIIVLWLVGGIASLAGALVYAELAMKFPGSGGEYNYLSHVYGNTTGFLAGWVTTTIAFPAPIAAISIAFAKYIQIFFPNENITLVASILIIAIMTLNLFGLKLLGKFQKSVVFLNFLLIISFIIFGFIKGAPSIDFTLSFTADDFKNILKPAFAVSLVYVAYAYTGWNAITYVAGEVKKPSKTIPLALSIATIVVTVIYILLNLVFLYSAPMSALAGKVEVAQVAAQYLFGPIGVKIISILIGVGLIASINSMMVGGAGVTQKMMEDFSIFDKFSKRNKKNAPTVAILFQSLIALILIFSSTFQSVIIYMGFTLTLFNTLAVAGIFIARRKTNNIIGDYKIPLYPITPLIFILIQSWMLIYVFMDAPKESLAGIGTTLLGLILLLLIKKTKKSEQIQTEMFKEGINLNDE